MEDAYSKEVRCCGYLIACLIHAINHENYERAMIYNEDLMKSLRELQKLKSPLLQQ